MRKNNDEFSVNDAMRLANSPAGQQLFAHLKSRDPQALQTAMDQAAAGNYVQAKQVMSDLLSDPKIQALLQQLGG